jgi:hypothetical protein
MNKTTKISESVDSGKSETKNKMHSIECAELVDEFKLSGGKTVQLKAVINGETYILLATKVEEK